MAKKGVKKTGQMAVLNANYMRAKLRDLLAVPHDRVCGHEFVASVSRLKRENGVRALDVAVSVATSRLMWGF